MKRVDPAFQPIGFRADQGGIAQGAGQQGHPFVGGDQGHGQLSRVTASQGPELFLGPVDQRAARRLAAGYAPATAARGRSARSLALLYLFRAVFSAVWIALVASLASAAAPGAALSTLASVLLVIYPLSDAVATVFDLRGAPGRAQYANLAVSLAATTGVVIALPYGLAPAITVFGVWAIASGAIMVVVALRRQSLRRQSPGGRPLGGQWPMIVSGAGSVLAGITFVGWAGSLTAGLNTLAQYSAGGALWYLLAAIWLLWSDRRTVARD